MQMQHMLYAGCTLELSLSSAEHGHGHDHDHKCLLLCRGRLSWYSGSAVAT